MFDEFRARQTAPLRRTPAAVIPVPVVSAPCVPSLEAFLATMVAPAPTYTVSETAALEFLGFGGNVKAMRETVSQKIDHYHTQTHSNLAAAKDRAQKYITGLEKDLAHFTGLLKDKKPNPAALLSLTAPSDVLKAKVLEDGVFKLDLLKALVEKAIKVAASGASKDVVFKTIEDFNLHDKTDAFGTFHEAEIIPVIAFSGGADNHQTLGEYYSIPKDTPLRQAGYTVEFASEMASKTNQMIDGIKAQWSLIDAYDELASTLQGLIAKSNDKDWLKLVPQIYVRCALLVGGAIHHATTYQHRALRMAAFIAQHCYA